MFAATLTLLAAAALDINAFGLGLGGGGGGCGCGFQPSPCPPQLPPPLPCPLPTPCPPTFCPPILPPPSCPPPIPCPAPLLLPPPPSPCGCGGGFAQPAPFYPPQPSYSTAPFNDCCCQCGTPCRYRNRVQTHGARIFSALAAEVDEDPTCNNEKLRKVIEEHITDDPTTSKRAIQTAAEEKLFAKINVICAKADFSYVAYTDTYCQASDGDVTCYAFRPLAPHPDESFAGSNSDAKREFS